MKNRDRLVGQQAGLLKLPRRSLSKYYIIPRKTKWYEDVLMKLLEPSSFQYELRCSRETFDQIVQDLHNNMVKGKTNWKDPVAVDKLSCTGAVSLCSWQ
ncbi:TPA: hypothetical protein ACH3X1_016062 [Trebouxia sp. C0004]